MQITLHNAGKRYNYEWVFQRLNYKFESDKCYAVLGPNGSGKSTLLQCISTYKLLNEGTLSFTSQGQSIAFTPQLISITAPYLELIEEFTLKELFHFQLSFKPFISQIDYLLFIDVIGLDRHQHKMIKLFSSGMKQRVKLALALLSDTKVVILDEPTSNLDQEGVEWYSRLIDTYKQNRIILIGSNDEREYGFCEERIYMQEYKT